MSELPGLPGFEVDWEGDICSIHDETGANVAAIEQYSYECVAQFWLPPRSNQQALEIVAATLLRAREQNGAQR